MGVCAHSTARSKTPRKLQLAVLRRISSFLDSIEDAVRCVIIEFRASRGAPASISTTQVLECVRRRFVDAIQSEGAADAQQAIHN